MNPRRHIKSRQLLKPTAFLLCAALLAALGCNKKDDQEDKKPAVLVYVQADHPEQGSISEQIAGDALLTPLAQAAISPKVTAPVKKFYVQRGAHVRAGQLLAVLENKDLEAAAIDNQGAYTAAQATYETATKATAPEDLTKAKLDLDQAKATLDLDQSIVNARKQLFQQGAIPGRDLDTAQATLVQAQAAYDIAQQHLTSLQNISNKAAIQNAKGTLESARGKYMGAEAQLSYTEIRTPISGFVTDRPLFAGETAAAGTALITVMDTSALIAKLHLAQSQAQQLAVGAHATLRVPGKDDPVPAKVSLVSPALDPGSTTVEVWLRVENPKGTLKAGTPVHATITGRTVPNALTIPSSAVITEQDGGGKYVMIVAPDSTAHKKPVTLGIQSADRVQVISGISANDMVISTGGYGLDENTNVKIGADPGAKDEDEAGAKDKGKDADEK
ncbi:MAG TPA: efflux RND transporter periplasmic adaptor subunit [Acidobacteriaceae bacterium]|nr:efflux RND transporter periplasmic adaptor subunit [Acidobacteriaceae bacterium]